jgi:hypothetical protein
MNIYIYEPIKKLRHRCRKNSKIEKALYYASSLEIILELFVKNRIEYNPAVYLIANDALCFFK